MSQAPELYRIWKEQKQYPVVFRRPKQPLMVKLPDVRDSTNWLKDAHVRWPTWNPRMNCFDVPTTWFDDVVRRAAQRWGAVYLIQLYREQQKCAHACWNAEGLDCECSCMGVNHGTGRPDGNWYEISESCALMWGEKKYACRLVRATKEQSPLSLEKAGCKHLRFEVVTSLDAPSAMVQCEGCRNVFALSVAIDHLLPLQIDWQARRPANEGYPMIFLRYGAAFYDGVPDGRCTIVVPDLELECQGKSREAVFGQLDVELFEAFGRLEDAGSPIPMPRTIAELQQAYPQYLDWAWEDVDVDIDLIDLD